MKHKQRDKLLEKICSNIAKHGWHIYAIQGGGGLPRFLYTIGFTPIVGCELILAGAAFYALEEAYQVVHGIADMVGREKKLPESPIDLPPLGSFTIRTVDSSWSQEMVLGALDYYDRDAIPAVQIVPDPDHWTVDVPDMSRPWNADAEPAWRWMHEPWPYPVDPDSVAATNLAALRGEPVTEGVRWEPDYWELFAGPGPDVAREEARFVPLATLLGTDVSLAAFVDAEIGKGLWRADASDIWHPWKKRSQSVPPST